MGVNEIGSAFHKKREAEKLGKWGGKKGEEGYLFHFKIKKNTLEI